MSLQPAIPWRVGLHQSPPPLHRPGSECITVDLPVDSFAASGQQCLIRLSQPRGPPQGLEGLFNKAKSKLSNASIIGFEETERIQHLMAQMGLGLKQGSYNKIAHIPFIPGQYGEGGLINNLLLRRVLPA